jgi:hypothetical protein
VKNVQKHSLVSLTVKSANAMIKDLLVINAKMKVENVPVVRTLLVTNATSANQDILASQIANPVNVVMMAPEIFPVMMILENVLVELILLVTSVHSVLLVSLIFQIVQVVDVIHKEQEMTFVMLILDTASVMNM